LADFFVLPVTSICLALEEISILLNWDEKFERIGNQYGLAYRSMKLTYIEIHANVSHFLQGGQHGIEGI